MLRENVDYSLQCDRHSETFLRKVACWNFIEPVTVFKHNDHERRSHSRHDHSYPT